MGVAWLAVSSPPKLAALAALKASSLLAPSFLAWLPTPSLLPPLTAAHYDCLAGWLLACWLLAGWLAARRRPQPV